MIVGYARVSSNDQNLERQLENLKTFCAEKYLQKNSLGNLLKIDQYFKKHLTFEDGRSVCSRIH